MTDDSPLTIFVRALDGTQFAQLESAINARQEYTKTKQRVMDILASGTVFTKALWNDDGSLRELTIPFRDGKVYTIFPANETTTLVCMDSGGLRRMCRTVYLLDTYGLEYKHAKLGHGKRIWDAFFPTK